MCSGPIVDSDFGDTVAALIAVKGGSVWLPRAERLCAARRDCDPHHSCCVEDQAHRRSEGEHRSYGLVGEDSRSMESIHRKVEQASARPEHDRVSAAACPAETASFPSRPTVHSRPKIRSGKSWSMCLRPDNPSTWATSPTVSRVYKDPTDSRAWAASRRSCSQWRCTRATTSSSLAKQLHETLARVQATCPLMCSWSLLPTSRVLSTERVQRLYARIRDRHHLGHSRHDGAAAHASRSGFRSRNSRHCFQSPSACSMPRGSSCTRFPLPHSLSCWAWWSMTPS